MRNRVCPIITFVGIYWPTTWWPRARPVPGDDAAPDLRAPRRADGSDGRPVVGAQGSDLLLLRGTHRVAGLGADVVVDRVGGGCDHQHREAHRPARQQQALPPSPLTGAARRDAPRVVC